MLHVCVQRFDVMFLGKKLETKRGLRHFFHAKKTAWMLYPFPFCDYTTNVAYTITSITPHSHICKYIPNTYFLRLKINQLLEFKLCPKINQLLPFHPLLVPKSKNFIPSIPLTYLSTSLILHLEVRSCFFMGQREYSNRQTPLTYF